MPLIGDCMNLREYLFIKRISVKDFSELLDYSRTHMSAIINGHLRPSKRLARAIQKATNGEVSAEEVLKEKGTQEGE